MNKSSKFSFRSARLYLFLLTLSTLLILYGTLFPVDKHVSSTLLGYDKLLHFLMFGAWSFFYGIVRFFRGHLKLYPVLIWGALFGLSVELLQHYLPTNRSFEMLDLIADLAGTLAASGVLYLLSSKIPWFRNNQKKTD